MKKAKIGTTLLSLGFVLLAAIGCAGIGDKTCGSGIKAQMLKRMLNAGDSKEYNDALVAHGPLTTDELPCVLDAIDSRSSKKRKNGATTLNLVGGDGKARLAAQKKVVLETEDLFVWAKVFDSLVSFSANANPSELASKRHDMIAKALADEDAFIQSVGLKAGVLVKYPGIEKELSKRLDSMDAKMLAVALDALPRETAKKKLPHLLNMFVEYEIGKRYKDSDFEIYFFVPLLNALIRTEDPEAYLAVRTALEKDYINPNQVRGTREELRDFRNSAIRPDDSKNKFLEYLIEEKSIATPTAIDILTTQVWTGKQKPGAKLVRICIEVIETGKMDTVWSSKIEYKPEQTSCERFISFLETGENPLASGNGKKQKHGSDSVEVGKQWLKTND